MSRELFELAILISLKDAASGRLDDLASHLRSLGKEGEQALKTFESLRKDMRQGMALGGIGLAGLASLKGGLKSAADFESAATELRLAIGQLGRDGTTDLASLNDQMARFETLGVKLGNTLPGSTQDFMEMFTVLKQGGIQTETILKGAGESVANLAVITGSAPRDLAKEFAQFGEQFQLKPEEFAPATDLFARLYRATGIQAGELIQGSKFFQLRAGLPLGLSGLQGAEMGGRLLATLRTFGLEGGIGGRELADFTLGLTFHKKQQQKTLAELHKHGVDLQFFDKHSGAFLGLDNLFKEMEKLRGLPTKLGMEVNEKLFGREAMGIAAAFTKAGEEGWRRIGARIDAVPPLIDQIKTKTETWNSRMQNVLGTWENVKATAFMPLMDTLKPALDATNSLLAFIQELAKDNEGIAQVVGEIVGLGSAILVVAGTVKTATAAFSLWKAAIAIGSSEQGVLGFLRNIGTETAATTTVVEESTIGWKAMMLSAGTSMGGSLLTGLAVAVPAAAIYGLISHSLANEKMDEEAKAAGQRLGAMYMEGIADLTSGKLTPQQIFDRAKGRAAGEGEQVVKELQLDKTAADRGLFGAASDANALIAMSAGRTFFEKMGYYDRLRDGGDLPDPYGDKEVGQHDVKPGEFYNPQAQKEAAEQFEAMLPDLESVDELKSLLSAGLRAYQKGHESEMYPQFERLTSERFPELTAKLREQEGQPSAQVVNDLLFHGIGARATTGEFSPFPQGKFVPLMPYSYPKPTNKVLPPFLPLPNDAGGFRFDKFQLGQRAAKALMNENIQPGAGFGQVVALIQSGKGGEGKMTINGGLNVNVQVPPGPDWMTNPDKFARYVADVVAKELQKQKERN